MSNILRKLDSHVQELYDKLYDLKQLLDDLEDPEIEQLADCLVEKVEVALTEGDISISVIKETIEEFEYD